MSGEVDADGRPGLGGLRRRVLREAAVAVLLVLATVATAVAVDAFELVDHWSRGVEWAELDELVVVLAASHLVMMVFGARRARDLKREFVERRIAEQQLLHRSRHDSLTGLLNRSALLEQVEAALGAGAADGTSTAVLLVDLDRFKEVNDTLGHHVGDELLRCVATRFAGELAAGARLARLGGDEFAVLLPGVRDAAEALTVAGRLLEAARRSFPLDGVTLEIDASIGVAVAPQHGRTSGDLLRRADVAMYAAKGEHCGAAAYSATLDEADPARLALYGELRRAIASGELVLHYQPKASVRTGTVLGVEALVRWQHPTRGLLSPVDFLDIAEQTGLIRPLTAHVLDRALGDARRWRDSGLALGVAVNLSARSLLDVELPDQVADLLRAHGLPGEALDLEITEGAAMTDPRQALSVLHRLRDLGVGLSVDDYGTGHASLAYLARLPVTALMIDRSFVAAMDADGDSRTIVRSTIDLARNLGLKVVAEGVETSAIWQQLAALGCDQAQGYWLARPAPGHQVPGLVRDLLERLPGTGTAQLPQQVTHRDEVLPADL